MMKSVVNDTLLFVGMALCTVSGYCAQSSSGFASAFAVNEPNQSINGKNCADDVVVGASMGITALPKGADAQYTRHFCKYTKLTAPNGKPIHFYAQDRMSNEQLLRAKRILAFYLEDVPDSRYGADKSAVFNAMADNGATLILLNGSDDGDPPAEGQTLYETENIIEGTPAYFSGEPRDAAYEEILHLLHDTGIGVDGAHGSHGVLPDFQAEIRSAMQDAIPVGIIASGLGQQKGLWAKGENEWLDELAQENSLTQEYLASVIDTYYGLAGKAGAQGHNDLYQPQTRAQIKALDRKGWQLVDGDERPRPFFADDVTRMVRLSPDFSGTFEMSLDEGKPYTWKSQYLLQVALLGHHDVNINGNGQDNVFGSNAGDNRFDGQAGVDTVRYQGRQDEYTIERNGHNVRVTDSQADRDGSDTLINIEKIQFSDAEVTL